MTKNALFRNTFKEINPNMPIILKKKKKLQNK